jgi:hypothetical protein
MKKLFLILPIILCLGCNSFELDEKWRPLEQMVERPHLSGMTYITTTIGTKIYRENIDKYLEDNPPGSPAFDSLLYHEQVHSKRQLKMGLTKWLSKYGVDTEFMWKEEQLGYYAGFMEARKRGLWINAEARARGMAKYTNLSGTMVSYEDALIWIKDVLASKWKPAEEDLWSMPDFLK